MNKNTVKKSALFLAAGLSLSFSAVSAAPAHAAGYGDQYVGWTEFDKNPNNVERNQGAFYAAPADTKTPVSDVYCFNLHSHWPGEAKASGNDTFTKKLGTAELFEQAATDEILQGEQLRAAVLNTIYNGYPNNASGIKEHYGLTDAELRSVTQEAIWYFTDGMLYHTPAEESPESVNRYAEIDAFNNLIGQSNDVQLTSAPANMSLDLYIPQDSTVQNLLGATFVPAAAEETVEIGTTATDKSDSDKVLSAEGGIITDVVRFENLKPGTEYTLNGKLMEKGANGEAIETGITATKTFTPEAADGTVSIDFEVPAGHEGKTLVAFEKVLLPGSSVHQEIAAHEDINDEGQTVTVSKRTPATIGTTASDKSDKDKVIAADGGIITDVVDYTGLKPGTEYTLTGRVMEKGAKGEAIETGITASKKFTAESADGQVSLDFTVPASYAGKTLVVFEKVSQAASAGTTEIAKHEDINSVPQTVTVEEKPAATPTPEPTPSAPVEQPSEEPTPSAPVETPSAPVEQPSEEPTPGDIEMPQTDEEKPAKRGTHKGQQPGHDVPMPQTDAPRGNGSNQGSSNQGGSAVGRTISRMLPNTGNDVTAGGLLAGLGLAAAGAASIVVGRKRK